MESKTKSVTSILLFFLAGLVMSCSQPKSVWQGTIELVDGVTIVKNPKQPMYGKNVPELEEELAFGGAESGEDAMLSRPLSIQVDDGGNIYILDIQEEHIKVFDPNGGFLRTIGQRGQGPGELAGPLNIRITSFDEMMVSCPVSSRLIYLSLDGQPLREDHMTKLPRSIIKTDSKGNFICQRPISMGDRLKVVLETYTSDQEYRFQIAEKISKLENIYLAMESALIYTVTPDDFIVWSITDQYEIYITNSAGKLMRKIYKDYTPVAITEEEKQSAIKRYGALRPEDQFPSHHLPIHDSISMDEDGRLYIKTYKKSHDGVGTVFDVFDREGRFLTEIGLGKTTRVPLLWKNHKLYTVEEDEDGWYVVKRYHVTWKM